MPITLVVVRFFSAKTLRDITGKTNILLMGPPGSGKTSISTLLSQRLNMPTFDIDNDHLESTWGCTVAEKLAALGDEGFLDAEAEATSLVNKQNTIISLTGSNPMRKGAMDHLRKNGIVVFLDVQHSEIVKRCETMKVDRIVGQASTSLQEILKRRETVYEDFYDVRVIVEKGANVNRIADQVWYQVEKDQRFFSTRNTKTYAEKQHLPLESFHTVVQQGLSDDRGLYFPEYIPSITLKQLERLVPMSYRERALRILELFPIADLHPSKLRNMLDVGYSTFQDPVDTLPLSRIEDKFFQLEEYHGPTASFKDLALQITPQLFQAATEASGQGDEDFVFIVATSGDTGGACLDGFGKTSNTPVIVLYPKGGVSPIQEAQMNSAEGDTCVISVDGDFDFCQNTVKDIFNNQELRKIFREEHQVNMASGNSINWGRLFPQIPYTFQAYLELVRQGHLKMGEEMDLCVPTGNFGNILGGVLAKKMGLPVGKLIVACNENNILHDFLSTGNFDARDRKLVKTPSPSIDILLPSNLERFLYLCTNRDASPIQEWFEQHAKTGHFQVPSQIHERMARDVEAEWCGEVDCMLTIRNVYNRTGQVLDPHTAVGHYVAEKATKDRKAPVVVAGTAHFSKFPTAVLRALGQSVPANATLEHINKKLHSIKTDTPFHSEIKKLSHVKRLHSAQCNSNREEIIAEIRKFLTARRSKKSAEAKL
jgi:threonine synthase